MSDFIHLHVHSHFSHLDGMTPVQALVEKAVSNRQAGMALTDHGTMSGVFQLYKGLRKAGLLPYPGCEVYIVSDIADKSAKRHHATLFALTTKGYEDLVRLVSASHTRDNYHFKPLIDWPTLKAAKDAGMLDDIGATTGCWFGYVQQAIDEFWTAQAQYPKKMKNASMDTHVRRRMKFMAGIFPNLWVELQHHSQPNDTYVVELLYRLAQEVGLPVVITQDSHYCDKKQQPLHTLMKTLAYGGDPGDVAFPGDSYHLATTQWVRNHYREMPDVWDSAMDSMQDIINRHAVKLPWLDSYQYHVPQLAEDPLDKLRALCDAGFKVRRSQGRLGASQAKLKPYRERLKYEMDIIEKLGMADYFLLVNAVCEFMQLQDIFYSTRGSANGSLVCWLLQITDVDPLQWKLTFDRFMSLDRERPPDIDLDVERDRRGDVAAFIFDEFEAMHIGTYMRMGMDEEGNGSIFRTFLSSMRRKLGPDEYKRKYGHVKGIGDLVPIHGRQYVRQLRGLGEERIYRSPGVHAAGFLLGTEDHPLEGQMPSMFIPSSNTVASMMMMEDAEDGGWIKLDLLGSATMQVLNQCMKMIGMETWHEMPLDEPKVFALLRRGETETGVFQLEGYTNAKGCREMKVEVVDDLIVCNALYRPATINAGHKDTYLRNRKNPRRVRYIHEAFEPVLAETYGLPVFQEQVMGMLRAIGFDTTDLNRMLKAIKASNEYVLKAEKTFAELHAKFIQLCIDTGLTLKQANEAWNFIKTFSDYSFNRAHATGYGLIGYYTAWLKVVHPLEYHTALLQVWGGTDKEKVYARTARKAGVKIIGADVNVSGANWTLDQGKGAIRRGLLSIKGIGEGAAKEIAENRPYSSIEDLIERTDSRKVTGSKTWPQEKKGVLLALETAGALKGLTDGI